jgi:hypothetical protein
MTEIASTSSQKMFCPHCGAFVAGSRGLAWHQDTNKHCRIKRAVLQEVERDYGGLYHNDGLSRLLETLGVPGKNSPASHLNGYGCYYPFWALECVWQSGFMTPYLHMSDCLADAKSAKNTLLENAKERAQALIDECKMSEKKAKAFTVLYALRRNKHRQEYGRSKNAWEVGLEAFKEHHGIL